MHAHTFVTRKARDVSARRATRPRPTTTTTRRAPASSSACWRATRCSRRLETPRPSATTTARGARGCGAFGAWVSHLGARARGMGRAAGPRNPQRALVHSLSPSHHPPCGIHRRPTHPPYPRNPSSQPGKCLYTSMRELVENSLDAAESVNALPEIDVTMCDGGRSRVGTARHSAAQDALGPRPSPLAPSQTLHSLIPERKSARSA